MHDTPKTSLAARACRNRMALGEPSKQVAMAAPTMPTLERCSTLGRVQPGHVIQGSQSDEHVVDQDRPWGSAQPPETGPGLHRAGIRCPGGQDGSLFGGTKPVVLNDLPGVGIVHHVQGQGTFQRGVKVLFPGLPIIFLPGARQNCRVNQHDSCLPKAEDSKNLKMRYAL